MYIKDLPTSGPHYVEGRKFVEKAMLGRYKDVDITVRTIFMDDKPLLKQYTFDAPTILKNLWKTMKHKDVSEITVEKGLDVTV